ncbi:potassium channel family protein [Pyrococcus kukulkanii]|uniref:potassium channel family protein n=1 Tax=Pyrococcus kukulkanii TaxID=1609559 RepID=UPI0035694319
MLPYDILGSQIKTLLDALWWSLSTLTTVGYGDVVPVTSEGRFLGIFLMIFGIAMWTMLMSLLTTTLVLGEYRKKTLRKELYSLVSRYSEKVDELSEDEKCCLGSYLLEDNSHRNHSRGNHSQKNFLGVNEYKT